jgi:deoxyribonuclease-4
VLHPGAYTSSSEQTGLRRVIRALNEVHRQTRGISAQCLLENTAGQGSCLGWRFEHLATILDGVQDPERLGVCFDTCHAFAAGYPLDSRDEFRQTMGELTALVGIERIRAIHLNDSKRELGSRVDRHEHIGKGHLGSRPFAHLLNDRRFCHIPMYLETPKGEDPKSKRPWDTINLRRLRRLVGKPPA